MNRYLLAAILCLASSLSGRAQESLIVGTWQGIFHPGPQQFRVVLEISRNPVGGLTALIYSPDQGPEPFRVDSISLKGKDLTFSVSEVAATWSGVLSNNGDLLNGTITQGDKSPLNLTRTSGAALWIDPHIHGDASFVTVAPGVQLQVIDWGGSGREILLLAGLGNTAHIYDRFAQQLKTRFHVIGITRRGFGDSSKPDTNNASNYTADRLGDDVAAAIAALHLDKPVLVGHSIAGEELSAVANRHPSAVSALVYLDAGYPYALYDPTVGDYDLDLLTLQRQLSSLLPGAARSRSESDLINELDVELPRFQRQLGRQKTMLTLMANIPPSSTSTSADVPLNPADAILLGEEKFMQIPVRSLAIFAVPHNLHASLPDANPETLKKAEKIDLERTTQVADSFAKGVPGATVLRLPKADHYVFLSNEVDVVHAIETFLSAN